MTSRRVIINVATFLSASVFLIALGVTQLLMQQRGSSVITAEFLDSSGLSERNDVTMRGVTVGSVREVVLTREATRVEMMIDPGIEVPVGTTAVAVRRSPIGDMVVELIPGDGASLGDGGRIPVSDTRPAPDAGKTVEVLADLLHAVPSEDLSTLVSEAAAAVRGRGDDLARLSAVTAGLPERILQVRTELESLIRTGPAVTGVLADNADVLADDITRTAQLADILRDRRYDLVDLYRNGAEFTLTAGELVAMQKANLACLVADLGNINSTLAVAENLANLATALDTNHYFFGGVAQIVRVGLDGRSWFRVQLLPHTEPSGRSYKPQRVTPDVYAANACRSRYGRGVGPGSQPGDLHLAPDSKLYPGK